MKSIIKQLYTILLVTVACLTVAGCNDDFKSTGQRLFLQDLSVGSQKKLCR